MGAEGQGASPGRGGLHWFYVLSAQLGSKGACADQSVAWLAFCLSAVRERSSKDTLAGTAAQGMIEVRWGEHCRAVSVWLAGQEP